MKQYSAAPRGTLVLALPGNPVGACAQLAGVLGTRCEIRCHGKMLAGQVTPVHQARDHKIVEDPEFAGRRPRFP